jgi:hypothetical protein
MGQTDVAMFIAKRDGSRVHPYDPSDPPPWADDALIHRRR